MAWRRPTTLALLEDHGASLADLLARNRGGDRGEEPPKGAAGTSPWSSGARASSAATGLARGETERGASSDATNQSAEAAPGKVGTASYIRTVAGE
jgi:hypothetical protein